jgi:hypothetical protein
VKLIRGKKDVTTHCSFTDGPKDLIITSHYRLSVHHPAAGRELRLHSTIFFSEVMHGEYWVQREECQIVCIIRKAKRYLDFVMACFLTDGCVLFGEMLALVLGIQYCEWLSNCSESCHERQKSSSHSQTSPSTMLAKQRSRGRFHVSLQGLLHSVIQRDAARTAQPRLAGLQHELLRHARFLLRPV